MLLGLALGICSIVAAALLHNVLLLRISALVPRQRLGKHWVTFCVFALLALVHIVEIVAFAAILAVLSAWLWPASLPAVAPVDLLYIAGINYTTLGYAQLEVSGPLRMVTMLQSLGGFMLLTWSAGYLYAACGRYWRDEEADR
ncbi:ion channel [Marinibaculum pumilum]|uniref:Ion channel n=1 Tax=Marinibaculum pumilum TaxID=1766165 RepID=A0ABV7L1E3_9PROT